MNHNRLRLYAQRARRDFIAAVTARAADFGLSKKDPTPLAGSGDTVFIAGRPFPASVAAPRRRLIEQIGQRGFGQVMEEMAYTWFNRFVAIRYMELHGLLDHGMRVLTPPPPNSSDAAQPEILLHALDVDLPGLNQKEAARLKLDGTKDEELYRLLLKAQCNALSRTMPLLFDSVGRPSELLLPRSLLHSNSLIRSLVNDVEESAWQSIETIGWLYQYYISERKDEVIGKVVNPEDIPAATQLFTPNWIVQYMVQNTLGATWLATYPDSPLGLQMEFYIAPAKQSDDVQAKLAAITPNMLSPEELTFFDPAVGSGHILVEAYDIFRAIYLERGYRKREIPRLILEKNLYGLDIDPRAAQLASFSLLMKGVADDPGLLEQSVQLNVMAFVDSSNLDVAQLEDAVSLADFGLSRFDVLTLKELFLHATTFGSLVEVPTSLADKLPGMIRLCQTTPENVFAEGVLQLFRLVVTQAQLLLQRYHIVVTNPPYMTSRFHPGQLKAFLKAHFSGYKRDLFAAFIARNLALVYPYGRLGFMTPFTWMFLSAHVHLRTRLLNHESITSLIQLEYSGFSGATVPICTFTLQRGSLRRRAGCYIRLSAFRGAHNQAPKTMEAIRDRNCEWFFETIQDRFEVIPGSPIAYWLSDQLCALFEKGTPLRVLVDAKSGLGTSNNDRFLRRWWEVYLDRIGFGMKSRDEALYSGAKWFPHNKGGAFRKWYGNHEYVVNWEGDGREIRAFGTEDGGRRKSSIRNASYYFRPALTWSDVTSGPTAFRLNDGGDIHGHKGNCAFETERAELSLIAGYCNTPIVRALTRALNPTLSFTVGYFDKVPFLTPPPEFSQRVYSNVAWLRLTARDDWDSYEASWGFQSHPLLPAPIGGMGSVERCYGEWLERNRNVVGRTQDLEEENNRLFIEAYGLSDELSAEVPIEEVTLTVNPAYRYKGYVTESERWSRFRRDTMAELISYGVGCMMGRYSLVEPGLVYAGSSGIGFEDRAGGEKYSALAVDDDGIIPITREPWFDDDAAHRLVEFISVAWNRANLEENLRFVADSLAPRKNESSRDTLRRYLAADFYKDHLVTYKNRPIYWLFSSGRRRTFQCLVYLHRYQEGTLARIRSDYFIPLQGMMASRLRRLNEELGTVGETASRGTKAHLRRITKERGLLLKDLAELRVFDDKLRFFADLRVRLDLDDGVKVNYGKFGDLLAEVRKVTGRKPTTWQ